MPKGIKGYQKGHPSFHTLASREKMSKAHRGKKLSVETKKKISEAHKGNNFTGVENEIKTIGEALNCEELWNINNGQTLCISCHNITKLGRKHIGETIF